MGIIERTEAKRIERESIIQTDRTFISSFNAKLNKQPILINFFSRNKWKIKRVFIVPALL